MASATRKLLVGPRFCGPPGTANGGFACGSIAAAFGGTADVTLHRPVPVSRPLVLRHVDDHTLDLLDGSTLLARARPAAAEAEPTVPAASPAPACRARYFDDPAFPGCFVCGTDRAPDDGLRIFPGPVPDRSVWVAPWTPHSSVAAADGGVRSEVIWAALDCPTGIAACEAAGLPDGTIALLGRMTARVSTRPGAGADCTVLAWPIARNGRKLTAGSALLDPGGAVLATARTLWITVPRAAHRQPVGATS